MLWLTRSAAMGSGDAGRARWATDDRHSRRWHIRALARMLAGADVPTPAMAVVRSRARADSIGENIAALRAGLRGASAEERRLLRDLITQLTRAQREALQPCNRDALWRNEAITCSQLVRGPFFGGGSISSELPAALRAKPWSEYVSTTARFTYTPGLWRGPLLVLVDGNSASSTELLAAMLQDAGRATIIGAPTFGSGCGWDMPHEDLVLARSGATLTLPTCARFRRDGRNELDGVEPDVLVGFRTFDAPAQRVARLMARLPLAVETAVARR